jgi:hypothetical protein
MRVVRDVVFGLMVLVACASAASAGTMGVARAPQGEQQLMVDWSRLSVAGSYQFLERQVRIDGGVPGVLRARQGLGHVGIDVFRWLTLSAAIGTSDLSVWEGMNFNDHATVFGGGLRSRFVGLGDTGPESRVGKWVIQAEAQYLHHEVDSFDQAMDWGEWCANLQLRYELFAFGMGEDTEKYPYSAAFYVGPTWSHLDGDIEAQKHAGAIAGIDVSLTHDFAVGAEFQFYEEVTTAFRVGYHF